MSPRSRAHSFRPMNDPSASQKRFGRDVLIAAAANLVRSMRNLILVPIITGHLSLAHYGEWELLAAAIALLVPWITFSLNSALIRFLPGLDGETVRGGLYAIFLFVFASSGVAALAMWLAADFLSRFAELAPLKRNASAIALLLVSTSLLGVALAYFRAFRQMLSHSLLGLAQHFGEVLLIAYLLQRSCPLHEALWALGGIRVMLTAISLGRIFSNHGLGRPHFAALPGYLSYSIPLIPNSLFYRLYDQADRLIIYAFLGPAAVGGYAAAYTAASLFTTLASPIHTVLLPAISAQWNQGRHDKISLYMAQTIRFSAIIVFPALACTALVAEPLFSLLLHQSPGPLYWHYLLLSLGFAVFGFGIPCGDLMATTGQAQQLFRLNGTLAATNLILNLVLVPVIGVIGAVIATLGCQFAYVLGTSANARRAVPYAIPWGALARTAIAATGMALCLAWLFGPQPHTLIPPILTGITVYTVLLLACGALTRRDLDFFASALGLGR